MTLSPCRATTDSPSPSWLAGQGCDQRGIKPHSIRCRRFSSASPFGDYEQARRIHLEHYHSSTTCFANQTRCRSKHSWRRKASFPQLKFACPHPPIPAKSNFGQVAESESLNSIRHVIENLTQRSQRQDGPSHFLDCGGSWLPDHPPGRPGDDPAGLIADCDLVIIFPSRCRPLAELAGEHGKPMVIGTTGHDTDDREAIEKTASKIPMLGGQFLHRVNLLYLTQQAARPRCPNRFWPRSHRDAPSPEAGCTQWHRGPPARNP